MNFKKIFLFQFLFTLLFSLPVHSKECKNTTIERMKTISRAIEEYYAHHGEYPEADSIKQLNRKLSPQQTLPLTDGWGKPLHYASRNSGKRWHNGDYWIGSSGGTARFEGFLKYILKTSKNPRDIIYKNGQPFNPDDLVVEQAV